MSLPMVVHTSWTSWGMLDSVHQSKATLKAVHERDHRVKFMVKQRQSGATKGNLDYYYHIGGRSFRSRVQLFKHLDTLTEEREPLTAEKAVQTEAPAPVVVDLTEADNDSDISGEEDSDLDSD